MEQMRHKLLPGVLCLLVLPRVASGQFSAIDSAMAAELAATRTPGAVIGVMVDNRVVYLRAYGVRSVATGEPVSTESLFRLASVTKMINAIAVLTVARKHQLDVNKPINSYIKGLSPLLGKPSFGQLLSHNGGLADLFRQHDLTLASLASAYGDSVAFLPPGAMMSYSSLGVNLSGIAAAEIAKRPYHVLVDEVVLKPVGMTTSTFSRTESRSQAFVVEHGVYDGNAKPIDPPMQYPGQDPSCCLYSTVPEMLQLAKALLNDGRLDGRQVISAAVVEQMFRPRTVSWTWGAFSDSSWNGYGTFIRKNKTATFVEHSGTVPGSAADVVLIPSKHAAVILLNNSGVHLTRVIRAAVSSIVPEPNSTVNPTFRSPNNKDFVGTYWQGMAGTVYRIEEDSARNLVIRQTRQRLVPIATDEFAVQTVQSSAPERVKFIRDRDGSVAFLHIRSRAFKKRGQ